MKSSFNLRQRTALVTIAVTLFSACTSMGSAERDRYQSTRFGDIEIAFELPGGQSLDFPIGRTKALIDPFDLELNSDRNNIIFSEGFWDYGPGVFGVDGSLIVRLRLRKVAYENYVDVSKLDKLTAYVKDLYGGRYQRTQIGGAKIVQLGSNVWVEFEFVESPEKTYFLALSESYFLEVAGNFVDNDSNDLDRWHRKADKLLLEIVSSVRILGGPGPGS